MTSVNPYGGGNANPGGRGGTRRVIRTSGGGGGNKKGGCCPMVAAIRSVKQGKFKLARRYAAMSVRRLTSSLGPL